MTTNFTLFQWLVTCTLANLQVISSALASLNYMRGAASSTGVPIGIPDRRHGSVVPPGLGLPSREPGADKIAQALE